MKTLVCRLFLILSFAGLVACGKSSQPSASQNIPHRTADERRVTSPQQCRWYLRETKLDAVLARVKRPGEGVTIAQIDTGYLPNPHIPVGPDVDYGIWLPRARIGYNLPVLNWLEPGKPPLDYPMGQQSFWGHGISMAEFLLAPPNSGLPFEGIAPYARLIPYRVTHHVVLGNENAHPFYGLAENMAKAIRNAVAMDVDIINVSLGAGVDPNSYSNGSNGMERRREISISDMWHEGGVIRRAVEAAEARGIIVVAATGQYVPLRVVPLPARYPTVIAVAASKQGMQPWEQTLGANAVDITAPGHNVCYARPVPSMVSERQFHEELDLIGKDYHAQLGEGTSYSAMMVSGIAAIWLSQNRDVLKDRRSIPRMFRKILREFGHTVPTGWNQRRHGVGIINAEALLGVDVSRMVPQ